MPINMFYCKKRRVFCTQNRGFCHFCNFGICHRSFSRSISHPGRFFGNLPGKVSRNSPCIKNDISPRVKSFILHILCYLKGKNDTGISAHTLKYEDIINNPREELEKIVNFLGRNNDNIDYAACLEAMNKDSQAKSEDIRKEKLAAFKKKNPITPELIDEIDSCFQDYGLPPSKNFDDVFGRSKHPDDR